MGWLQSVVFCLLPLAPGFAGAGWHPTQSGAYLIKVEYEAVDQNVDSSGTVGSPSPGASASTASSPAASKRVRGGGYPVQPYPQGFSDANKGTARNVPKGPYIPPDIRAWRTLHFAPQPHIRGQDPTPGRAVSRPASTDRRASGMGQDPGTFACPYGSVSRQGQRIDGQSTNRQAVR